MATSARNVAWILKDLTAYPRFDAVVAVGDRVAHDLFAWPVSCVLDGKHVHVIRNGIDTATFRPNADAGRRIRNQLGWDDRLGVIISASRLHRQKGLAYGLEGFALLTKGRTDLRYLIVGDGPELGALRDKAVSLGIDSYVHFTGGVARSEIPAYLNAADAMLFTTTRIEGEPMNVLEALASGLPAVVSRHLYRTGAPSDQIIPVKPNSPSEVATALQQALALSSSGESKLPAEYSADSCIAQYLALFHNLAARMSTD
jgi:glycosyltransferase involved in cell wall biosynthesis